MTWLAASGTLPDMGLLLRLRPLGCALLMMWPHLAQAAPPGGLEPTAGSGSPPSPTVIGPDGAATPDRPTAPVADPLTTAPTTTPTAGAPSTSSLPVSIPATEPATTGQAPGPSATAPPVATAPSTRSATSPRAAGLAGALVPGLGHLLNGRPDQAALIFGGVAGLLGGALLVDPGSAPFSFENRGLLLAEGATSLWLWSSWDAYQQARAAQVRTSGDQRLTTDRLGLTDLLTAPFCTCWFGQADVVLPLLILSVFTATEVRFSGQSSLFHREQVGLLGQQVHPLAALPVQEVAFATLSLEAAVGEEAFFRGLVLQVLGPDLGPGWANAFQASLFGLAHFPNPYLLSGGATVEDAIKTSLLTGLLGAYLGHLTQRRQGDLRAAIAFHFWYNFLLMTTAYLGDPTNAPFQLRIAAPF